jgi:hypothetical protein
MARPLQTSLALYRIRRMAATGASGDYIWNELIFQPLQLVFDRQLFLFHPLNLQRIAASLQHGADRRFEIRMILFEPRKCEAHISLFLFGHRLPVIEFRPHSIQSSP